MEAVKFIGIGDTHLRDTQYGSPKRGEDFRKSLCLIVDDCIARKNRGERIAGILHAGDLLDNTRPSPATLRSLDSIHKKLIQADLPMFVISGNHDRTHPHWASVLEPASDGRQVGVICADHMHLNVHGVKLSMIPYCTKEALLQYLEDIPEGTDIVMWHGAVYEFIGYKSDTAISLDELPTGKFKYFFVGDTHVTEILQHSSGFVAVSPGSTEVCRNVEPLQKYQIEFEFPAGQMYGAVTKTPIATRKFLTYRLLTDADVASAIDDIKSHLDKEPVVIMRVHPDLGNVKSRLLAGVDNSKCMLIMGPLPSAKSETLRLDPAAGRVRPSDIVYKFAPPGTALYDITILMADPDSDEKACLEEFCEKQLL